MATIQRATTIPNYYLHRYRQWSTLFLLLLLLLRDLLHHLHALVHAHRSLLHH
jgi:hypothetical protein